MKDYFQIIKRWDVIISIVLILLSFLPFAVFSYQQASVSENSELIAVISVDNEEVRRVPLTGYNGSETFDINVIDHGHEETNTVEVRNEEIRIKSATCSDQVCVRTNFISRPGQTIVCLPNRVVIEVQSTDGTEDETIISY